MPTRPIPHSTAKPPTRTRWTAWWRQNDGSASTEVTLVTPLLAVLLVIVGILIHRGVDARIRVEDVAHQAARAASLQHHPDAAVAAARYTALKALVAADIVCRHHQVITSTHGLRLGSTVHVTVTCDVDIGDTLIPGLTTTQRVSATAHEPVDQWRSTRNEP